VPVQRQGLAFGVKEASIPAATLAAGIAVPTIALTVGWRWAFAIGLIPWLAILILLPTVQTRVPAPQPASRPKGDHGRRSVLPRRALVMAAAAAAFGTGAASGVGIFLTDSAVAMGSSPAAAGLLLALGSVAGIVARVS